MANRLINETSPYLLQHAHNPVDWYPWGEEALQRAKDEDKPMLVSIGYSACHWCHVMEKESFENEETAALMNQHFINIKIDREERPDLDNIYMEAVQAMTGSGGWPLNVFLTPGAEPFYGGTYFPPRRAFNRASWPEVILSVARTFSEKREEVNSQAKGLTDHLLNSNSFGLASQGEPEELFKNGKIDEAYRTLMQSADREWGGFGRAPKFPQTFSIMFLLRYFHLTGQQDALDQACLALDKMIEGGIYDQLGGGFARYSTDQRWLVPHFEKMLYDNALLVATLSEAYQLTRKERYREVIIETIRFVKDEFGHPGGGFYAAFDADSEGVEGKYYTWDYTEIIRLLGGEGVLFCEFFGVSEKGNLPANEAFPPGQSILHVPTEKEVFAKGKGLTLAQLNERLERGASVVLNERTKRKKPLLDDKIILSWNALMNMALSKAFEATGVEEFRHLALANMEFLLRNLKSREGGGFHHSWKGGQAKDFGFLDDYAFLVQAMLKLHEITGDTGWLYKARNLAEFALERFGDEQSILFFFTDIDQGDLIVRKKELYDGATPSGNGTMAYNLHQLSIHFDLPAWKERAIAMLGSLGSVVTRYPTSFGVWLNLLMEMVYGTNEIVVAGKDPGTLAKQILAEYIPHKVFTHSTINDEKLPLLSGKPTVGPSSIYLCKAYSCLKPVSSVKQLLELLQSGIKIDG